MKSLNELLKSVYEKHTKTHDLLAEFDTAMRKNGDTLSTTLQKITPHLHSVSYHNQILTIGVPVSIFSPEIYYFTEELKNFLKLHTKKNIRSIRFYSDT